MTKQFISFPVFQCFPFKPLFVEHASPVRQVRIATSTCFSQALRDVALDSLSLLCHYFGVRKDFQLSSPFHPPPFLYFPF
jgi:hypothetical protein